MLWWLHFSFLILRRHLFFFFFFFNDTATTEIYTLSLHDALPISLELKRSRKSFRCNALAVEKQLKHRDRKSTRLNSSHSQISYAVFCLKKKKTRKVLYRLQYNSRVSNKRSSSSTYTIYLFILTQL